MADTTCAACGAPIDEPSDVPADERMPCPRCGSTARAFAVAASMALRTDVTAFATVERGLNDIRLAVLGILVTIGLSVGFGVGGHALVGAAAGLGAFALAAFLVSWKPTRKRLMAFAHRLTGH